MIRVAAKLPRDELKDKLILTSVYQNECAMKNVLDECKLLSQTRAMYQQF